MSENLFRQSTPLCFLETLVKAQDSSAPLETIPRHLQFVHRMHILHMHLYARPIRRLGRPEVQILVPPHLKVQRVITVVQICQLREEV
jgi:hypothetical protein